MSRTFRPAFLTYQREFSLLTGEPRPSPTHPIRRSPGAIRIGNRITYWTHDLIEERATQRREEERSQFNAAKQQRREHECAAAMLGDFCPHAA